MTRQPLLGEDRHQRLSGALRVSRQAVTLFAQLQHEQFFAISQNTLRQLAAGCADGFATLWAGLNAGPTPEWLAVQELDSA